MSLQSSRLLINICPECRKRIENYGQPAFNLVYTACKYFSEDIPVFINMDDPEVYKEYAKALEWLEKEKKILSTADIHKGYLAIKPNASFIHDDGFKCYCWCEKNEMC